jgi:hypothetical protein
MAGQSTLITWNTYQAAGGRALVSLKTALMISSEGTKPLVPLKIHPLGHQQGGIGEAPNSRNFWGTSFMRRPQICDVELVPNYLTTEETSLNAPHRTSGVMSLWCITSRCAWVLYHGEPPTTCMSLHSSSIVLPRPLRCHRSSYGRHFPPFCKREGYRTSIHSRFMRCRPCGRLLLISAELSESSLISQKFRRDSDLHS